MRPIVEWARRHAEAAHPGNAVDDLLAGMTTEEVARRRGLPVATVEGVATFYDRVAHGLAAPAVCDGTACHFEGGPTLAEDLGARAPGRVRCVGMCHDAPAVAVGDGVLAGEVAWAWAALPEPVGAPVAPDLLLRPAARPVPLVSMVERPVALRSLLGDEDPERAWELPGGDEILSAVLDADLRGRGGAAFPTGRKWRVARDTPADERYVVANGDEGDPGSFADRVLLEQAPQLVLAGMKACARAIDARRGVVYVRGEYARAGLAMVHAIHEARARGWLGGSFDVEVHRGGGAYVCGEETALLRSVEGLRAEPSPTPPWPAERGLYGRPTVVQNVETLAVVPWVVRQRRPATTKLVSVSGAVARPCLVEVPLGMPLRRVLEEAAGGPAKGRRWRMALVGGPMGRVVPASAFDVPLSYTALPGLGHAGVVVLDDLVAPADLARHLFAFAAAESCGACTPCRVGTARLGDQRTLGGLERLLDTLEVGSLCGFGQGVPRPVRDLLRAFGEEVLS